MATKEQSAELIRQAQRVWDEAHRKKKDLNGVVNVLPNGEVVADVQFLEKEEKPTPNS